MELGDWLREEANRLSGPVTVGWLARQLDGMLPGAGLIMAAAPSLLPVPGIGNVTGVALLILAWGLARGTPLESLALPGRLANLRLSPVQVQRLLRWLAKLFDWAGRMLRPRWSSCVGRRAWTCACLPVGAMGVVIFLPIPLGNVFGGLALVLIGLGQCLRDGLWVSIGWIASMLTVAYCGALTLGILSLGQSVWAGPNGAG